MINKLFKTSYLIAAISSASFSVIADDNLVLSKKIATIIDAKPLTRLAPKYPISEARQGREGWVVVSYIVEPNGKVSNAVIEDSSGSRGFEKESLKALKKWRFEPATENGEVITQCKNTVQLDFKMSKENVSVSKKFYQLYRAYMKALQEDDNERVLTLQNRLKDFKINRGIESYYQHLALAQGANQQNNKAQQLYHLTRALRYSGERSLKDANTLSQAQKQTRLKIENNIAPVLHQKLVLELDANKYVDALSTIDRLLALEVNKEKHNIYTNQKGVIDDFINSDNPIVVRFDLANNEMVSHKLLRNNFQLDDLDGRLTKLDIRCRNQRHLYTVNDKSQWKIPDAWQACSVYFYGEDNTKFSVIELPENNNQALSTGH